MKLAPELESIILTARPGHATCKRPEVLIHNFNFLHCTGWIQGLSTEPPQKEAGPGEKVKVSQDTQNKITHLK